MRAVLAVSLGLFALSNLAAQPPAEIDPNTRIQGGADTRGSGANAGTGAPRPDDKTESGPPSVERGDVARPEKTEPKQDKPISERTPRDREPEAAGKGETARPLH